MSSRKRVLLTGATGHVGGRLFKHLVSLPDISTRAWIRSSRALPEWASHADLVVGDIADSGTRKGALHDVDVVVHATRGFPTNVEPTTQQIRDELSTTLGFVRESIGAGVRRFIFLSSIHVYGGSLVGVVNEDTPCRPLTPYGMSRLKVEEEVRSVAEASHMEATMIRLSNAFGVPGIPRDDAWSLLVHDVCRQIVQSMKIILRSDERTRRDVISLHDVTTILTQVITSERYMGETYVLASGRTMTIRELAELVRKHAESLLGIHIPIDSKQTTESEPASFVFEPNKLRAAGIEFSDHREAEIRDLFSLAMQEFRERAVSDTNRDSA